MLESSQILTYINKHETNVCCRETHFPFQPSAVHSGGLLHRDGPRYLLWGEGGDEQTEGHAR